VVDAAHPEAVPRFGSRDESEPLGEGVVLEPAKSFLGATDIVSGDRSATMLRWQRLDGHIKGEADVIG
jgi:hypothetical protein